MKALKRYLVTATMLGGHIIDSELYLDSILSAVHPAMHGREAIVRSGLSRTQHAPLPCAAYWDGNRRLVWLCSSANYVDGASVESTDFTKRRDPMDAYFAARGYQPASGTLRDRMEKRSLIMAPRIQWSIATNDPKELQRLLRRVSGIGALRKMGYGEISRWEVDEDGSDITRCLVDDGKAVRRIPISVLAFYARCEPISVMPPYWYMAERVDGVVVGTPCELKEGLDAAV